MAKGITLRDVIGETCSAPDCSADTLEDVPLPICRAHYAALVRHFFAIRRDAGLAIDQADMLVGLSEPAPTRSAAPEHVYFIRYRDRLKIGTTSNVARRLSGLPYDEVLAVIPGGRRVEREWHQRYEGHRDQGEWFTYTEGMLSTIRGLGICAA